MWDNLEKTEINALIKFHNKYPERSKGMIKLTFGRLLSLARTSRASGRTRPERREMMEWVMRASSRI